MKLKVVSFAKDSFCIDDGSVEKLKKCPCCGADFKTAEAAQLVADAIETGQFSWEFAKDMQWSE